MVEVINIHPDYERLLLFFYPTYSYTDQMNAVSHFIAHKDLHTRMEREMMEYHYTDCVIISKQIFDAYWDEEVLKAKALAFAQTHLKCRKRIVRISPELKGTDFCDALISWMFTGEEVVSEESAITTLFDQFGSKLFTSHFLELAKTTSPNVLVAAMLTFATKVLSDTSSIYYKRKQLVFADKIRANFSKAMSSLKLRPKDQFGISYIKFFNDLSGL